MGVVPAWPDMDFLIARQADDCIFGTKRPKEPAGFFLEIFQALAFDLAKFLPDLSAASTKKGKGKAKTPAVQDFKRDGPTRQLHYMVRYIDFSTKLSTIKTANTPETSNNEIEILTIARAIAHDSCSPTIHARQPHQYQPAFKDGRQHDEVALTADILSLYLK